MSDRFALIFAALILGSAAADYILNDGAGLMFLARKFVDMVDWVEFWR